MNNLLHDATPPPNPPEGGLKAERQVIFSFKEFKVPLRGVGGPFRMCGSMGLAAEIVSGSMVSALPTTGVRGLIGSI